MSVSADLAKAKVKYENVYEIFKNEIRKCDRDFRGEVNARIAQYPVSHQMGLSSGIVVIEADGIESRCST